ncbi:hypothetical protein [Herbidospora cretacea]|uniref:hypothetical protein n=1 Tax=Herbidospora cretacea TaxID=28444 RepID=UPI000773D278|nr:hypothetical protein [Herbidospora cretacea]
MGFLRRDPPPPPLEVQELGHGTQAFQAMLVEYNWLRQESLNAISNRVTIANFMFGAMALILAALIGQPTPTTGTALVSLICVPQIAKVGLMIWLGEYNRSQRAGKWLAELEVRINAAVGRPNVLSWESTLLSNSLHMSYPYSSVLLLLLGAGWAGIFVGVMQLRVTATLPAEELGWLIGGVLLAAAIAEICFIVSFRKKWLQIKRNYSKSGPSMWTV